MSTVGGGGRMAEAGGAGAGRRRTLVERLREVLAESRSMTAARAAAEQRIAAEWEQAERTAKGSHGRVVEREGQKLREKLAAAERERADRVQAIEAAEGATARRLRAEYEKTSRRIQERGASAITKVKASMKESAWMNETLIESDRSQAADVLRDAHAKATIRRGKIAELRGLLAASEAEFGISEQADEPATAPAPEEPASAGDSADSPSAPVESRLTELEDRVAALARSAAATVVRKSTLAMIVGALALAGGGLGWFLDSLRFGTGLAVGVAAGAAVGAGAAWGVRGLGLRAGRARSAAIRRELAEVATEIERKAESAAKAYETRASSLDVRREEELREAGKATRIKLAEIEAQRDEASTTHERDVLPVVRAAEADLRVKLDAARDDSERKAAAARKAHDEAVAASAAAMSATLRDAALVRDQDASQMASRWAASLARVRASADELAAFDAEHWPEWGAGSWESWAAPIDPCMAARIGTIGVDLAALPGGLPADPVLTPVGAVSWRLPVALDVPRAGSLLVKFGARGRGKGDGSDGRREAVGLLRSVMLRYLTCLPPGKARFTIIDPVSLGQDFAGFMHLADYNEAFITHRIWTEPKHIEQRLTELTEHMESVIQSYLRNQFETIADYNEQAGEIAEPYRFLVISGFPIGFDEGTCRRLASIIASGARCGVYTLIALDRREELPNGISVSDIEEQALTLAWAGGRFTAEDPVVREWDIAVDAPPADAVLTPLVRAVGEAGQDATRVEVPFDAVSPGEPELWSQSSAKDIAVALGRAGATKLQRMSLGRGTAQHALIAGKTGSGKSTMLHVYITNLALWYSPDEVEFYLVDFKKGVEFKTYATHDLPHARAIAIESDREFGLSVLRRVDAELKRRGDLFRDAGVQDMAGFRAARPDVRMPRTLLIIDEFQELFVEDDSIAGDSSLLLDRLVRQGRAFGIHIVLGSQTLGGAYTLARSTMGQMGVRIALQCSEADSYLIMNEDNAAARLLTRPGEAIYNDASGLVEGNSPFQIVWLPEGRRERALERVRKLARDRAPKHEEGWGPAAIVFEGNQPADLGRNAPLRRVLAAEPSSRPPAGALAWLGDAVAIKDPTAAKMGDQSGANLLVVSQQEEAAIGIALAAVVGLSAQHPRGDAMFYIVDPSNTADGWHGASQVVAGSLPHDARVIGAGDVSKTLGKIAAEVDARTEAEAGGGGAGGASGDPAVYLVLLAAQRLRDLRRSDDFGFSMDEDAADKPDKLLAKVLRDGPPVGVHVIAWCDTLSAAERLFDRQSLREFDGRVLFQMSASDSTTLIDTPAASKLGPHRALFYSEEAGTAEVFRPYRAPDRETLERLWGGRVGDGTRAV